MTAALGTAAATVCGACIGLAVTSALMGQPVAGAILVGVAIGACVNGLLIYLLLRTIGNQARVRS